MFKVDSYIVEMVLRFTIELTQYVPKFGLNYEMNSSKLLSQIFVWLKKYEKWCYWFLPIFIKFLTLIFIFVLKRKFS